ncbi:CC/Se motif family (seleno)protein [Halomonas faecis]|uniref:CC/Se motif family (seleno)protein n=1 Tax=Halomonas faecis TaxID=1562110 RepID=UPI001969C25A|nr:CC/Se motif family (seleno)protein [Halomonas faecis]
MAIEVTAAARAWLVSKGGVATVRLSPRHGCCGGGVDIAVAEARTPNDPKIYKQLTQDGLTLFIEPSLADQGLVIDASSLLGFTSLFVEGASPHSHGE